jgi:predicted esterase
MQSIRRFSYQLGLCTVAIVPALTQDSPHTLADLTPRGEVVPRLRSRSNPKASYAVFLPSAFTRDRTWPVVFLLDPRGRALIPMELFRPTAERLGYVLVSSYDTQSDGARDPNDMAIDAMLDDAQRYLAPDGKRLYLAGFSGTSRFSWDVSEQLPGALAGILGFGAGTPGDKRWLAQHVHGTPFDYFGAVGAVDPNYLEMRQLQRDLTDARLPFRMEIFDGSHRWPPADVCRRALEWMELRAMQRGLRPLNRAWVDSLGLARLAEVDGRAGTNEAHRMRLLQTWLADFGTYNDTAEVAARARTLAASDEVRRIVRREDEWEAKDLAWTRGYFDFLFTLRTSDQGLSVNDGKRRSSADEIVKLAGSSTDPLGAMAARRAINRILVYATFYELRGYEQSRRWEPARILLQVAEAVAPQDGNVCFALARVEAQLLKPKEALDHLECAERSGGLTQSGLRNDSLFAPIRDNPRFSAIEGRLPR